MTVKTRTRIHDDQDPFDQYGVLKDGRVATIAMTMRDSNDAWRDEMHDHLARDQKRRSTKLKPSEIEELEELNEEEQDDAASSNTSTQDEVARSFGLNDSKDLHKPGYRRVTDAAALDAREQAYRDADQADATAYQRLGSKHASPNHVVEQDFMVEVPDTGTGVVNIGDRELAYAEYDARMQNAWRNVR